MNRALVEADEAHIAADPDGELEEPVGIYQAKGLDNELARRVAAALTERDPVAAHADAELRLADLGTEPITRMNCPVLWGQGGGDRFQSAERWRGNERFVSGSAGGARRPGIAG